MSPRPLYYHFRQSPDVVAPTQKRLGAPALNQMKRNRRNHPEMEEVIIGSSIVAKRRT